MKKLLKIYVFLLFILISVPASSGLYIGAGGDVIIPIGALKELNKSSFGVNLILESRNYCKLWYGLRIDYSKLSEKDGLLFDAEYYTEMMMFSPEFRYNFCGFSYDVFGKSKFDAKVFPYLQVMLPVSSISGKDEAGKLGLGLAGGGGFAMNFKLFESCWMLDINALYSANNLLLRSEERPALNSVLLSFNLSVGF